MYRLTNQAVRIKAWKTTLVVLLFFMAVLPAQSQQDEKPSKSAAFLFAYYPKAGSEALFKEGYRRHLQWHVDRQDPLSWYAWYVVFGSRMGLFIDGTFGLAFSGLDKRIDPAGDAADFAQTTAPFAEAAFRSAYILRRDLSTVTLLEELRPTRMIQVVYYTINAGREIRFESVLRELKKALASTAEMPPLTWYELTTGGNHPSYLLMIPQSGWADFDNRSSSLAALLTANLPETQARGLLDALATSTVKVESEVWLYQPDLSHLNQAVKNEQ